MIKAAQDSANERTVYKFYNLCISKILQNGRSTIMTGYVSREAALKHLEATNITKLTS